MNRSRWVSKLLQRDIGGEGNLMARNG